MDTKRMVKEATAAGQTFSSIALIAPLVETLIAMMGGLDLGKQSVLVAVTSLPALFYIWWTKQEPSLPVRLITTAVLLLRALLCFVPSYRARLLVHMVILLVLLAASCICFYRLHRTTKKGGVGIAIWIVLITSTLGLLFVQCLRFSYEAGVFLPLWQVWLGIGAAFGIFVWIKWLWKKHKFWGQVGYFLLTVFLTFLALGVFAAAANYALDFSEPRPIDIVIEDQDIDRHRKGPDDYQLIFTLEGTEYSVNVPYQEFRRYEIGDTYRIYRYNGALGEPFFVASGYVE